MSQAAVTRCPDSSPVLASTTITNGKYSQPPSTSTRTIKIAFVSDLACIWCFLGMRAMEIAIDRLKLPADSPVKFEFEHRPYLLNPSLKPDEIIGREEFVKQHYGENRWESATALVNQRSKELGINLSPDGFIFNTLKCHRLLLLAWKTGREKLQRPLLNLLFEGLYLRGEDLSKNDLLARYASQVGLMSESEALDFLSSNDLKAEVQRMAAIAQQSGVTGVPFVLLDGKWAISGSQTEDVYFPLFQKLVKGEDLQ